MEIYVNPERERWRELCRRPSSDNIAVRGRVAEILDRVKSDGDKALLELSTEIDGLRLNCIEVTVEAPEVGQELAGAIDEAYKNIYAFHSAQMPKEVRVETAPGVTCIQRPVPIKRVGLYIPGGTAPLFSTVLMLAVPAKIAGCSEVILCTPAGRDGRVNGTVLYAAQRCGVDRIFCIGGAQAIAAMAYGTGSVPKVDKIFGPGNQYVTAAKQMVAGADVSIDMPAGPSEVMVIADDGADPEFAAADLLSQAEHGRDSQVVLVCRSVSFAERTVAAVKRQCAAARRRELAEASLSQSRAVVLPTEEEAVAFAEAYAPEHLIICTRDPWKTAEGITAAGSVFIGDYTPESAGDYASGTNHTLPTCGWARSCSGVNIDSYMRKMTLQSITKDGLRGLGGTIVTMAEAEGLEAHANAVRIRTGRE